jgi:hypothetical protein
MRLTADAPVAVRRDGSTGWLEGDLPVIGLFREFASLETGQRSGGE